jgi:processive 1,2-diacylglycerol beta-glucosyltransferase
MQRILILSASVGAGHLRAAQAVELAARQRYPEAAVHNVDVLSLSNALFRRLYGKAYLDFVNRAPHMLGYLYDLADRPRKGKSDRLSLLVQKAQLGRLMDLLGQEWDVVISTHFLPAAILAGEQRKGRLGCPHVTVTTDFETHRLWVNEPCDAYSTATEEGARYLASWGVEAQRIHVTGIPIHPAFAALPSRDHCRQKLELLGDRPVVLQLAGGFGVGPIRRVHEALLSVERPITLLTICGRNVAIARDLAKAPCPSRHSRQILGFTDAMHELMRASDLVVSKPGGLTSSEALAAGVPMLIVNPIPGQESRNADYLLEHGAAWKANNLATLAWKAQQLLGDDAQLGRLQKSAAALGRPTAAFDVLDLAAALTAAGSKGDVTPLGA